MERKLLKRKAWSNDSGVSEIVGNILILMITVVLFSGIMMFVNQMPVPELTTKADFSAALTFETLQDNTLNATLTVTHVGGATMESDDTLVLVSIDDLMYNYKLDEDTDFGVDEWAAGLKWVKVYNVMTTSIEVSVTIVDEVTHNAVWVSQVSGGMGLTPPNILQRYVDSNRGTITVDPVKRNDNFTLFVKISDFDNDLVDVWVDNTSLPNGVPELAPTRPSTVAPDGGWFEWDFNDVTDDVTKVDGKVLVIYAEDDAGHTTIVPFKLTIIVLPTDTTIIENPGEVQEGGMPSYIKNVNQGQGFAMFGENVSAQTANLKDPKTVFNRTERVYIRAASMYVDNVQGTNDLTLRDARSGVYYTGFLDWDHPVALSSLEDPFYAFAFGGNVYVYQCVFNTSRLMPGTYLLHATLKCTGAVEYTFTFDETLYIVDKDSPMTYSPKVWVSRDSDFQTIWGNLKTKPFNSTGENYMMYVGLLVQDTEVIPSPTVGEIRIVDMTGGAQVSGPPNSGDMISAVTVKNLTAYYFYIDLRYANGEAWKLGTNSYTLQISQFTDSNEGVYAYSTQVFIRAPSSRSDFFIGTNGVYASLGSSTNFISPDYMYHIENNNFFTMRTLYNQENAPSTAPMYYHNAMALGDLDNDGDLDLLVGSNMDKSGSYPDAGKLLYIENTLNTFGVWQSPAVITRPATDDTTKKIKWIDTGDINGDGYTDFAYVTTENRVWIFNNTYGTVGKEFLWGVAVNSTSDGIRKLALEDMTGDGRADLILLKEGAVMMYDLSKWRYGYFAAVPDPAFAGESDIIDFDIADMNCDGMLDVVTADYGGVDEFIKGVWVNNYTTEGTTPVVKRANDLDQFAGYIAPGTSYTDTRETDGISMTVYENDTDGTIPRGTVDMVFTMEDLGTDTDPLLCVNASLYTGGATTHEVFYVWYAIAAGGRTPLNATYTPVMVIDGEGYTNYTYPLPSTAVDEVIYVKITDSSTQIGDLIEELRIDYLAILSDRLGTYYPNPPSSPSRYQVTTESGTAAYTTVRAINFDGTGDGRLEVAVAKNDKFVVYDIKAAYEDWTIEAATGKMWVYPNYGVATTVGKSVYEVISPTMFEVADVNGDGREDILTCWISVGDSNEISLLKLYVNVGYDDVPWIVNVKDLFAGMISGAEKGSIVCITAGDIYLRSS